MEVQSLIQILLSFFVQSCETFKSMKAFSQEKRTKTCILLGGTHPNSDLSLLFFHSVPYTFSLALALLLSLAPLSWGTNVGSQESTPGKGSRLQRDGKTQWCDSVPNVYRRADIVRRWRGLKWACLSLHS